MSNHAFQAIVQDAIDALGQHPQGKRWTIRELADATKVSRATLYNWLKGTPAAPSSLKQFASALAKLKAEAIGQPEAAGEIYKGLFESLQVAAGQSGARRTRESKFGFVPYPPICGLPQTDLQSSADDGDAAHWSFLGSVFGLFQRARGDTVGGNLAEVKSFDGLNESILTGFFVGPQRAKAWRFLRVPIQVPLNAIILRRDLAAFVRHVLPDLRIVRAEGGQDMTETYLTQLRRALWRLGADEPGEAKVKRNFLPLTVKNEAGRNYVQNVLGFSDLDIEMRSGKSDSDINPNNLKDWLMDCSDIFQSDIKKVGYSTSNPKFPILIIDELSCMRILSIPSDKWGNTDPILVSSLSSEVLNDYPKRPRHNISIAVKREKPDPGDDFESVKTGFEEVIWSNAGIISALYARTYMELVDVIKNANSNFNDIGYADLIHLYALRWLSLELSVSEQASLLGDSASRVRALGRAWSNPAIDDCAPWADIIAGAKAILLADPVVREQLKRELESLVGHSGRPAATN